MPVGEIVAVVSVALSVISAVVLVTWKLAQRLASIDAKISRIDSTVKRELEPNGGRSLKDRVMQHGRKLDDLDKYVKGTPF